MATIRHEVWINAPAERVYGLLESAAAISTWWDQQTEVSTPEGLVFEHTPGPEHGTVRFLILERHPDQRVRWRCISQHPSATPASAWTNTEITFEILPRSAGTVVNEQWAQAVPVQTVLMFSHAGWDESSRYFGFCNYAWVEVLGNLARKAEERV